jgi:hypothetical protein
MFAKVDILNLNESLSKGVPTMTQTEVTDLSHQTAHLANDPRWNQPVKVTRAMKRVQRRAEQAASTDRRRSRVIGWADKL